MIASAASTLAAGRYCAAAGLRPTRQRVMLGRICCSPKATATSPPRCFTPRRSDAGCAVAQATVYNTLNQFTQAGLLRRIGRRRIEIVLRHQHYAASALLSSMAKTCCSTFPSRLVLATYAGGSAGHEISRRRPDHSPAPKPVSLRVGFATLSDFRDNSTAVNNIVNPIGWRGFRRGTRGCCASHLQRIR